MLLCTVSCPLTLTCKFAVNVIKDTCVDPCENSVMCDHCVYDLSTKNLVLYDLCVWIYIVLHKTELEF